MNELSRSANKRTRKPGGLLMKDWAKARERANESRARDDEFSFLSYRLDDEFVSAYANRKPAWGFDMGAGNTLGEWAWFTKYSRVKPDGTKERFYEGLRRVIEGMFSIQKDHALANRLPWDEDKAHMSAEEAYDRAFAGKWSPPGRGFWMMGTEFVNGRQDSSALQNCFTGDTKIVTRSGEVSLKSAVNTEIEVWSDGDWRLAQISEFGMRDVQDITFGPYHARSNTRIIETATPDHRWPLRDGTITTRLKVGDVVMASAVNEGENEEAFRHGLIFADGSVSYLYQNGDTSHCLRLCGAKERFKNLFGNIKYQPNCNGDPVAYHRSPVNMKELPKSSDPRYVRSFIMGWAALDGSKTRFNSVAKLATQDTAAVQWILDHAVIGGYTVSGHSIDKSTKTNFGTRAAPLHVITLREADQSAWTVKSIKPAGVVPVFCATVPATGLFTLASGIYTGNCGFLSTKYIGTELATPFVTLMNMSMLGVGVGFDTLGAGALTLNFPVRDSAHVWVIEDSREGWCKSVEKLLLAYFTPAKYRPVFDYSQIRPAGSEIKGFGGTSAGPEPLKKLHNMLRHLLSEREGDMITSSDIVDIMNMIGKCVVAANVRSSAEIALGDPYDNNFLSLKDWRVNPDRMGADGWGYTSNNSVVARQGDDLSGLVKSITLNGEPGIFWMDVVRQHGRVGDYNDKDRRAMGVNPCGEQPLENHELCTLVETYPTNHRDLADYCRTLKFAYLYGKSVTLLATQWPRTNEVMIRNRRIGTSMTGIAQFADEWGWTELRRWQNEGYNVIREWDEMYSEWLGVRESVRVTTVKPSGTVSLLFGVTPGCHWPKEAGYYLRTVRENRDNPIVEVMRAAGYRIEPNRVNPDNGVVIYLPVVGPEIRPERDVSVWEKVALAAHCQKHWSDNSVSVTATFNPLTETDHIGPILRAYDGQLKSLSFLPDTPGVYDQAPYQRVSQREWLAMYDNIKPIDWETLYGMPIDPEGERYCTNDVCEVP